MSVALLLVVLVLGVRVGLCAEAFRIFWNQTGVYVVAYPIGNITFSGWMLNAFYDLRGYRVWKFTMSLPAGTEISFSLGNYTVSEVGGSGVTISVPANACVYVDAFRRWYCGFSSGATYSLAPANTTTVVEAYNACIVIVYQPVEQNAPQVNTTVQVYDYYTQRLLKTVNFTSPGYVTVCGVSDIVLLNVTMGSQWLGLYYLAMHLPTTTFPQQYLQFGALIPLGFFLALAVRNKTRLGALGAIIYGFLFDVIVSAFGLQNIFSGAFIMLISCICIMFGVGMLLFSSQRW